MIESSLFLNECKKYGLTNFTGTPCSYLKPFINFVIEEPELDFYAATNEGDAVALASGFWLAGKTSVVMFQNSGLGNAVNPITSLSYSSRIPFLGITTWRGEPGGKKDEPQHELMGQITTDLLTLMKVAWEVFPTEASQIAPALKRAVEHMNTTRLPYFFVMKEGSVNKYELSKDENTNEIYRSSQSVLYMCEGANQLTRTDALKIIRELSGPCTALLATTGKTGRELFELGDTENQFYMVGSMGCASATGLGMALMQPKKDVVVIDGDGALLMRLENLALSGQYAPENMIHIVLDNNAHDSTGGQRTDSNKIDFCQMANACGYKNIIEVNDHQVFAKAYEIFKNAKGLTFVRFMIKMGSPEKLGRPTVTPDQVALRMKDFFTAEKN
ncbi:MAG: phosphonopyruvate decarboxylase [Bdellovibrio sp.]